MPLILKEQNFTSATRKYVDTPFQGIPGEKDVHVWITDLKVPHFIHLNFLESLLSQDELNRAEKFKFPKDKKQFVIAHAYLRLILSKYTGCLPNKIEYEFGRYGKPFLKKQPGSMQHLSFNMSHAGTLGAYAIANKVEVGIDIEYIKPHATMLDMSTMNFVLTKNEREALNKGGDHQRIRNFLNIWTSKEAFLKGIGVGLNYPPHRIEISQQLTQPRKILTTCDMRTASTWCLYTLDCPKTYVGTVAVNCPSRVLHYLHNPLHFFNQKLFVF